MAYISRSTRYYTREQLVEDQKNCPELKIAYGFLYEDPDYFERLSNTDLPLKFRQSMLREAHSSAA